MEKQTQSEKEIFYAALELTDSQQRRELLDSACQGNRTLRGAVERLLAAHGGDRLPISDRPHANNASPIGQVVGNFKLLEKIGEGGFGDVYMADQLEPIQRRVALKIIKAGMDTHQVIARFEAERQALALMDHPNIAKVLDAGTTETARPYFVMELVRGVPVTEYCDDRSLSTEERLNVFMQICSAVQHAHQKGIIHRDLKPSNILVTTNDDSPVPKVIDFGIAKATRGRLTEKTLFTQFRQFVGTPAYMSPEQAQMSAVDVDTRSDLYSLGVLLYELLTGTTPLNVNATKQAALDEICRSIRQDEAPKPSTRLSTLAQAERAKVAEHRKTEPAKLSRLMRGELDWIVMKAIDKDRSRRYESASNLAADVARYLEGEPVDAGPPTITYRVRKFVTRNCIAVSMAMAVAIALVVGTLLSTVGLVQARRAQRGLEVAQGALTDQLAKTQKARQESEDNLYISDMNRAAAAYDEGNISLALSLLAKYKEEYGDRFEWRCLDWLCRQGDALQTYRGHTAPVKSVAVSPNGVIASGDSDGVLKLVDMTSMTETTSRKMASGIERLAFTPNGQTLAVLEESNKVTLWTVEPLEKIDEFQREGAILTDIEFMPDGTLAIATETSLPEFWGPTILWDLESGELRQVDPEAGAGRFLSVSPTGRLISFVGPGPQLHVARLSEDGAHSQYVEIDPVTNWHTEDSAFSQPDGKYVAVAAGGGITIWDVAEAHQAFLDKSAVEPMANLQHEVSSHRSPRLAFSPNGRFLVSGGADGNVKLWRGRPPWYTEESALLTLRGHSAAVNSICYSPDGKFIVTGSDDHTVKVWPGDARRDSSRSAQAEDWIFALAFTPDGRTLAAGGFDGRVRLYDTDTMQLRYDKRLHENQVLGVAISPDGKWLATCEGAWRRWGNYSLPGNGVSLLNLGDTDEQYCFFVDGLASVKGAIDFSPDGRTLLIGDDSGRLWLWDVEERRIDKQRAPDEAAPNRFWHAQFSPDGKTIATSGSRRLELRDADTLEVLRATSRVRQMDPIDFSADGRLLATGHGKRIVMLNAFDLSEVETFEGHLLEAFGVAFRGDGKTLASCSGDGTVRLWNLDLGIGREVAALRGHRGGLTGLAFSHDGAMLASSGEDKTIHIWRTSQPRRLNEPLD